MKDPAFLFYVNDWAGGTQWMTRLQRGAYLDLLLHQVHNTSFSLEDAKRILGSDFVECWPVVSQKFEKENGKLYSSKMRDVVEARRKFTESRRNNRLSKPIKTKHTSKTLVKLVGDGNGNGIINENRIEDFEKFRKDYPGLKRGYQTELDNFKSKHNDWKEIIPILKPSIDSQKENRESMEGAGDFVPPWKHLRTWINQRCWEQEFPTVETHEELVARIKNELAS